jgi:hypothetical protein
MQKIHRLIDDEAYITAHEKISSAPGQYHMAYPPVMPYSKVGTTCAPYVGGCKQKHVTSDVIDTYNSISVPVSTRPNEKPSTELFSPAPYKARGDGVLLHPEMVHKLQTSGFNPKCNKTLSEVNYDRFHCINAPLVVEDEEQFGNPRGGEHTRVGPRYHLC